MNNPIYILVIEGVQLQVIYDKREAGLYEQFSSDDRMHEYTHVYTEEAFVNSVHAEGELFVLNIASTEDFGAFEWKNEMTDLLKRQLSIFEPIIQRFIVYIITEYKR